MKEEKKFRSADWFGRKDKDGIIYRSWIKNEGMPPDMFDGRPVIGICNTFSELTPCNAHFRDLAEMVKRGVLEAGGFPALTPNPYGQPNNPDVPNGTFIRRLTYPTSELSVNTANVGEAIGRQGPDKLSTKIWWDK